MYEKRQEDLEEGIYNEIDKQRFKLAQAKQLQDEFDVHAVSLSEEAERVQKLSRKKNDKAARRREDADEILYYADYLEYIYVYNPAYVAKLRRKALKIKKKADAGVLVAARLNE